MKHKNSLCPLCRGKKVKGKTTFTAELGFGIVVIRQVPAIICSQCGSEWMDDKVAEKVESIVTDASQKQHLVEITSLA